MIRAGLRMMALGMILTLAACGERELILTGERLPARAGAGAQSPDVARPISLPAQVARADWTQKASGADNLLPHSAFGAAPTLIWSAAIGQGQDRRHRITADPVVAGGRVFTVDSRARVMAHSTGGAPIWAQDVTPVGERPQDASGAGLAVAGGRLFVSTGFGDLVALDAATGREIWRQELDASAQGAPTVAGDLVYVAGRDARGWAVEVGNGRVRWQVTGTPVRAGVGGGAAPAAGGGLVIFPFASRELVAAFADGGTQRWVANVAGTRLGRAYAGIGDISGDPVITGGRVYAGSPAGRIAAVELGSGEVVWSAEEGALSPVAVLGGSVFAVTDRAELVRLDDETGARIWGTELPYYLRQRPKRRRNIYAHYGPVPAGGRLWIASGDGALRGFDAVSGAQVASAPLPGGAATNPVVAGRAMYVVSQDGRLLAFR